MNFCDGFLANIDDTSRNYFIKLGIGIFVFALLVYSRSRVAITSNCSWDKKLKADRNKLIKTDIYQTVRHPQYTSYFLAVLATGLMLMKVGIVVFSIALIPLLYLKMKVEEEILIEVFPKEYKTYKKQTGMFF